MTAVFLFTLPCAAVKAQDSKKVQAIVAKEVKAYRQILAKDENFDSLMIAFSIDTFKVEHTYAATIADMVNAPDMLDAAAKATAEYDKLLNKYYGKLMAKLTTDDKKELVKTQKAWLAFRDAEQNLIAIMSAEQYSGGGSIQKDVNEESYQELVKSRLVHIFKHLNRITNQ